MRSDQLRAL